MASDLYETAIRAELTNWPGVEAEFGRRAKHRQVILTYAGQSRFVVYPDSGSDNARGHLNNVRDVRKELVSIGAKRAVARRAAVKQRAVKRPRPERPIRVEKASARADPFAVLAGIQFPAAKEQTVIDSSAWTGRGPRWEGRSLWDYLSPEWRAAWRTSRMVCGGGAIIFSAEVRRELERVVPA